MDIPTDDNRLTADLQQALAIDTSQMDWAASPAPGVDRKRLFRNGPTESGRVTSLVRYAPGSEFPSHPHPEGEEIFVLSGVFSDARGDWPAGSYMLNPEGFEHSPGSECGCELFVRLRQAPGNDRQQVGVLVDDRLWHSGEQVDICHLWSQPGHDDTMRLERWHTATDLAERSFAQGIEYLLLDGAMTVAGRQYPAHSFFRVPPGQSLAVTAGGNVTLLAREGGFNLMR